MSDKIPDQMLPKLPDDLSKEFPAINFIEEKSIGEHLNKIKLLQIRGAEKYDDFQKWTKTKGWNKIKENSKIYQLDDSQHFANEAELLIDFNIEIKNICEPTFTKQDIVNAFHAGVMNNDLGMSGEEYVNKLIIKRK